MDNLSLLKEIGYDQTFTYAYSRREQTYAGLFMQDDVPEDIKSRRLTEMVDTFQSDVLRRNIKNELGRLHVVLVEGYGKDSTDIWTGRTDTNKRVLFSSTSAILEDLSRDEAELFSSISFENNQLAFTNNTSEIKSSAEQATLDLEKKVSSLISTFPDFKRQARIDKGIYVIVKISACRGHTLRAVPIARTTLVKSRHLDLPSLWAARKELCTSS